jgi:hypothetical protein
MNHGGQTVKAGLYLGLRSGEWVTITRDGVVLPGTSREIYVGRKTAIAIGPFLGLAYFVFFPAVGLVLGIRLMSRALIRKTRGVSPVSQAEMTRRPRP